MDKFVESFSKRRGNKEETSALYSNTGGRATKFKGGRLRGKKTNALTAS
jgi:hypothetical protein